MRLVHNNPKLLFLRIALAQIILFAITIFFAGGGHGTYVPFAIFYGWFSVPFFITLEDYFFAAPVVFFFITLIIFATLWFGVITKKLLWVIIVGHFAGAIIGIVVYTMDPTDLSVWVEIIMDVIAIYVSYLFWRIFSQVGHN